MLKNIIRALRLPFLSASVLPFVFGSLIERTNFNILGFFFGFLAVTATHLSANLINDYADSKTGADWQDRNFYKFFGGSKLIQENLFSEKFYLKAAFFFAVVSCLCVISLAVVLNSLSAIGFYLAIIILSWSYSEKPLQFSYRGLGEIIIFILFGPALVMGGYFIQTKIFPDLKSFLISLPFGFLTTAILFANEVPDFIGDKKVKKLNWVSLSGPSYAFISYFLLIFFAFLCIFLNIKYGYLKVLASFAFVFILPAVKAGNILRKYPFGKMRLLESSKLTIAVQTLVSITLILAVLL